MTSTRLFLLMLGAAILLYGALATVALRMHQAENSKAAVTTTPYAATHGVECTRGKEWPRCYTTTGGEPDHDH